MVLEFNVDFVRPGIALTSTIQSRRFLSIIAKPSPLFIRLCHRANMDMVHSELKYQLDIELKS